MSLRTLPALLLVFALGGGCAVNPVTGQSELMLVSEEQELAMGRQAYPTLVWQDGGPYRDPALTAYLAGIVRRLHAVSHRPNLPVDFTLENTSVPNAWAIPGHTAMNRGLLVALENEAQFAFVMGHEMGHVAARHSARRQSYGLLEALGAAMAQTAVATQKDPGARQVGDLLVGFGLLGSNLLLLKYDREQELEADRLGVLYMARAGHDPREALRAHQRLAGAVREFLAARGKRPDEPSPWSELFATHPRHEVRLAEVEAMIRALPPGLRREEDGRVRERWEVATRGVSEVQPAYLHYDRAQAAYAQGALGPAEGEVAEAMRLASSQAPFPALLGAIRLRQGRTGEALSLFRQALALDPEYQPARHGVGTVRVVQDQYRAALPDLEQSLQLFPAFLPSRYLLGVSELRLGAARQAIPHLRTVAEAAPKHPAIHGLLGQALEEAGQLQEAAGAYRAQLQVAPESELGQVARRRFQALRASLVTPYASEAVRVRLVLPPEWSVGEEQRWRKGGSVLVRRAEPSVVVRIASTDFGPPQDIERRLDEYIAQSLRGEGFSVREVNRQFQVAGERAIWKEVGYRSRGVEIRRAFIALGRGGRVFWIDIAAAAGDWSRPEVRRDLAALLESLRV